MTDKSTLEQIAEIVLAKMVDAEEAYDRADEILAIAIQSPEATEFQMNKVKPIIGALMFLIETKRYKDKHGKTQEYQVMRGEAWSAAEQALKEAQSE